MSAVNEGSLNLSDASDDDSDIGLDGLISEIEQEVIQSFELHNNNSQFYQSDYQGNFSDVSSIPSNQFFRDDHTSLCCERKILIADFPVEILSRILSYSQSGICGRVCTRWLSVQIRLARNRCLEAFETIANLPRKISEDVEKELFKYCEQKTTSQYQKRARSLIFNLKGNPELRQHLLNTEIHMKEEKRNTEIDHNMTISPSEFVRLSSTQMATKRRAAEQSEW
eukprot:CAMPEP_0182420864 /NCGR_PEP_ID=MMETSP1167-20130531/5948_1 /TAXON_ID=2988 /ORGANISM="Mallomonas Sp, Strain CCMP3275" /LENGTH=224 /DNA_ID=CAMNT_0024597373 /DNA_START=168 /DNA_END=839 /DNA_ORIENTATION=+